MKNWIIIGTVTIIVVVFLLWLLVLPIEVTNRDYGSYVMLPYLSCNVNNDCTSNSDVSLCCINRNYQENITELIGQYEAKCSLDSASISCRCYTPENWSSGFCTAYDYTYKPCTGLDCARQEARELLGI